MTALGLAITVAYLVAMWAYGHLCYVQGVMDRDERAKAPAVIKALRFGRRYLGSGGSRRPMGDRLSPER